MKYKQGIYKPIHPEKYVGNAENIIYRSSWEKRMFYELDNRPDVIQWSSEELAIPYFNPVDQKTHRYFPDLIFKVKQKSGSEQIYMVEIKPHKQTNPPKKGRNTQNFINETVTYTVNQAKWKHAEKFCKDRGWIFKVITEKDLNFT